MQMPRQHMTIAATDKIMTVTIRPCSESFSGGGNGGGGGTDGGGGGGGGGGDAGGGGGERGGAQAASMQTLYQLVNALVANRAVSSVLYAT